MKKFISNFWRIGLLLLIAAWGYIWATGMMDSLFEYRSPLRKSPPVASKTLYAPITRQVVLVIIDALREDTSLKKDVMPNLNQLRQRGAWARMHSQPPSFSQPGYSTILTGAWPELNDSPVVNVDVNKIWEFTQDDLFSAAKRAGLHTTISAFDWFEKLLPDEAVDEGFFTQKEDRRGDLEVVGAALPWLRTNDHQLVLIHLDQVDYAGHHEGGPRDPRWDEAAKRCDDLLGEIIATLDLQRDIILVISDHGQIDRGGHGGQEAVTLIEPFVLAGYGIKPGHYADVQMVDVAPTLAALLGTSLPASTQGRVLIEMLDLTPQQEAVIVNSQEHQQKALGDAYRKAVLPKETRLTTIAEIRTVRLWKEQLPRFVLAILPILTILFLIIRNWNKQKISLFIGAILYLALFNIRFLLIDGRGYSLSSMEGVNEAILYFGSLTITTLVIALACLSLSQKWFTQKPGRIFRMVMDYCLVLIFILAIPVMFSYGINGWKADWHLPEFNSVMTAFINTFQITFSAAVAIPLAALSGGIAAVWGKKSSH